MSDAYYYEDVEAEPYYGCALCSHDMTNECGPSAEEHDLRRICICCAELDCRELEDVAS